MNDVHLVHIGNLTIGKGKPILVQTMYDDALPVDMKRAEALLIRIGKLNTIGCDIIRFSYPSKDDHEVFKYLAKASPIPIVADIHLIILWRWMQSKPERTRSGSTRETSERGGKSTRWSGRRKTATSQSGSD